MNTPIVQNKSDNELFAKSVQQDLLGGQLHMKHIVGLTDREIVACIDVAKKAAALGSIEEAQSVFSLILANDPINAMAWSEYTLFLEQYCPDAPQLETCRLTSEALDTDGITPFSKHRSVAAQESSMKKWAQRKSGTTRLAD